MKEDFGVAPGWLRNATNALHHVSGDRPVLVVTDRDRATFVTCELGSWWQLNGLHVGGLAPGLECVVDLAELDDAAQRVASRSWPFNRVAFEVKYDGVHIGDVVVPSVLAAIPRPPALTEAEEVDTLRFDLAGAAEEDVLFETPRGVVSLSGEASSVLAARAVTHLSMVEVGGELLGWARPRDLVVVGHACPIIITRFVLIERRDRSGQGTATYEPRRRYVDGDPPADHHTKTGAQRPLNLYAAVHNPDTDVQTLLEILDWEDDEFRAGAAANPALPEDIIESLTREDNARVRAGAARNPCLNSVDVIMALSKDDSPDVRAGLASNPAATEGILARLAEDPRGEVRAAVASNDASPVALVERLSHDHDWVVREGAASSERLPSADLERLANDREESVLQRVAENRNTPPHVLLNLGAGPGVVPYFVARNTAAPVEVLHRLATHPDGSVRAEVARNQTTAPRTLAMLANDDYYEVLTAVYDNQNTPRRARAKAHRELEVEGSERRAVGNALRD